MIGHISLANLRAVTGTHTNKQLICILTMFSIYGTEGNSNTLEVIGEGPERHHYFMAPI